MMLTDMLALCHVPRWSIVPHSRPQSVAEHSFRVAVISFELISRMRGWTVSATSMACLWALIHDAPECRTGDIPASYKRAEDHDIVCPWFVPYKNSVSVDARSVVKLADRIEAYTYIKRWGVGKHAEHVADAIYAQLLAIDDSSTRVVVMALVGDIMDDRDRPYESYRAGATAGEPSSNSSR